MNQVAGKVPADDQVEGHARRGAAWPRHAARAMPWLPAAAAGLASLGVLVACSGDGIQGKNLESGKAFDADGTSGGKQGKGTNAGTDETNVTTADSNAGGPGETQRTSGTPSTTQGGTTVVTTLPTMVPTLPGNGATGGTNTTDNETSQTGGDANEIPVPRTIAEMVASGPQLIVTLPNEGAFTEGPLWHPSGYLLFSEHREKAIWKWTPGSDARKVRNVGRKTNGLTFDPQGNIVACEDAETTVARFAAGSGARTVLASTFQEKMFNGPNDCIVDSRGAIYFTDPWYGLGNRVSDIGAYGVYRVAVDGVVTQISTDFVRSSPNGLGLSPDEATLYVANTGENAILSFARGADGAYGARAVFASSSMISELMQPDGLKISAQGHVIVGVKEGVLFLNPDGTKLGFVRVRKDPTGPENGAAVAAVSNVAFGGPDFKSLFLTSKERLFRIELSVKGARPWSFTSALPDPLPQ